jgi:hypothetical protein
MPSRLGWLVHWRIQGLYWNETGRLCTVIFDTEMDEATKIADVV